MRKLASPSRTTGLVAIAALALAMSANGAGAVDYSKFPSFQYFDVDKENGVAPKAAPAPSQAAERPARKEGNSVHVVEQDLRAFLMIAGKRYGTRISVSSGVRGTIRDMSLPGDLDELLRTLAAEFGFEWFREGDSIQVSSTNDSVSRVIFLGRMDMEELKTSIAEAGLSQEGYELNYVESSNSVLVKGPVSLIARIELMTEAFNKRNSGVRVIRRGKES